MYEAAGEILSQSEPNEGVALAPTVTFPSAPTSLEELAAGQNGHRLILPGWGGTLYRSLTGASECAASTSDGGGRRCTMAEADVKKRSRATVRETPDGSA